MKHFCSVNMMRFKFKIVGNSKLSHCCTDDFSAILFCATEDDTLANPCWVYNAEDCARLYSVIYAHDLAMTKKSSLLHSR
mmetsp:Transcript_13329/g.29009  ORF Transcript_13329/g.29009 Transcript_13329/m.29009 type:complete len:80 (+) Transcript_13329:1696-1935(+)